MYVSMYKCGCGCMYHVCRTDHPTCILSCHTVAADDVGYVLCMKSTQTANQTTINETHMHNTNTKITTTTQQQQQVGRTAYRTTTRPNRLHTQPLRPGQSRCARNCPGRSSYIQAPSGAACGGACGLFGSCVTSDSFACKQNKQPDRSAPATEIARQNAWTKIALADDENKRRR